ncbi:hypothetical protein [Natrinema longum]|uniref:DUF3267 domain-containing protein n=1 Tax=Natrinema longum TaxID=370324 RepID=A0A8A2UAX7_9EURY|nr:hypothetical protein [Natrinema longum]MBZ6496234.1 hypothetical protein [Natrinema longum]QSW85846.1 hypothetical protein J0X27_03145 [Natrinema longum]
MIDANVVVAGCALVLAVAVGLVAHEWTHAAVLRLARVEYSVSYFPGRSDGILGLLVTRPWAVVSPRPTGGESPWALRLAALAPFVLAVPVFGLAGAGYVTTETPIVATAAIGWLACALPSPQDFSVAFHVHRLLEETAEPNTVGPARAD